MKTPLPLISYHYVGGISSAICTKWKTYKNLVKFNLTYYANELAPSEKDFFRITNFVLVKYFSLMIPVHW